MYVFFREPSLQVALRQSKLYRLFAVILKEFLIYFGSYTLGMLLSVLLHGRLFPVYFLCTWFFICTFHLVLSTLAFGAFVLKENSKEKPEGRRALIFYNCPHFQRLSSSNVMVDVDCPPDRIQNLLGDKPLGTAGRGLPCLWRTSFQAHRLNEEEDVSGALAFISLLPDFEL